MGVLKAGAMDGALRRPSPDLCALLIYGASPDGVRDLARKAVTKIAGSADDPFSVARLDEKTLSADPGLLADEFASLSMLGGKRAVWIKDADQGFLKAVEPILEDGAAGNIIVAEAGSLAKSSRLRTVFEKSPRAFAVPVYEEDAEQFSVLVAQILSPLGLSLTGEAETRLLELLGPDFSAARQQVSKLATYCLGAGEITRDDVEAICGDSFTESVEGLTDSVFTGLVEDVDRGFASLIASGIDAGRILTMAGLHVVKLQSLRLDRDKGMRVDDALRAARPPIFFKRYDTLRLQLGLWDLAALLAAASTIASCIQQMRRMPQLADVLASRTLLALARNARALAMK